MKEMPEEAAPPKALWTHCVNAYKEMLLCANEVPLDGEVTGMVYEGHLTKLFKDDLHLSVPYYTSVMQMLQTMGCVKQLSRGGSTKLSQWLLVEEPTLEVFEAKQGASPKGRRRYVTETQWRALQQQVSDQNRRLNRIESALGIQGL